MIDLMSIISNTSLIIGAVFLIYFTYLDYKEMKIENQPIFAFLVISLVWAYISSQFWLNLGLMAFLFVLGLYLWHINVFGGADVKILPCIIPFMQLQGMANSLVGVWFYLIILLFVGTIYGLASKYIIKTKEIPFLPVITLSYLIFWFYKLSAL